MTNRGHANAIVAWRSLFRGDGRSRTLRLHRSVAPWLSVIAAAFGSARAQQVPGAGCCPGGCPLVLPAPGQLAESGWGLALKVVSAAIEDWPMEQNGRPVKQKVLAVVAEVSDPAWSDLLKVDDGETALLDATGNRVARAVFSHNDSDSPYGTLPARREGVRTHTLSLKFGMPPASAAKPLWLSLQFRRYRNQVLTFEWRDVGPNPQFPLQAEKDGLARRRSPGTWSCGQPPPTWTLRRALPRPAPSSPASSWTTGTATLRRAWTPSSRASHCTVARCSR
jgi:hypothetical protein